MKLTSVREIKSQLLSRQASLESLQAITERLPLPSESLNPLMLDEEREIARLQVELDAATSELSEEINRRVSNTAQRRILILRYVDCLSFKEIARRVRYSERNCYHLHRRGKAAYEGTFREKICCGFEEAPALWQMTNFESSGHGEWLYGGHNQKLSQKGKNGGGV